MADRGRKKLPRGMAVVNGSGRPNTKTRGKHKRGDLPEPPAHLNDHATTFWNDVAPILEQMGVGTQGDKWTMEGMAVLYGQYRDALSHCAEHGDYQWHEKKEAWVKNPALVTVQQNLDALRKWFNEVGLTPSARAKIGEGLDGKGKDNPFAGFA